MNKDVLTLFPAYLYCLNLIGWLISLTIFVFRQLADLGLLLWESIAKFL